MTFSQVRRTLDTLLDPSTQIDLSRQEEVQTLVLDCLVATLDIPSEFEHNQVIKDRCAAVISRWKLYL